MSWESFIPPKPTKAERRALASLQKKIPGVLDGAERVVMRMAACKTGRGRTRIQYKEVEGGITAHIEVFSLLLDKHWHPISFPVIPDEFNPDPHNQVTPDMQPHVFESVDFCRLVAEQAENVLLKEIRAAETEARKGRTP